MPARDVLGQTLQTLWAHKLRSLLTMFGITWGVMSLLLLGAVGEGFRDSQRKRLAQIGQDLIFVWGGRISQALQQLPFPEGFSPPTVTWRLGFIALFVLALVALAASLLPARRAALLPPAEAIRYEVA